MKSRISFFNRTVLRKDITRFAPLWAIYLIGGLLVMLTTLSGYAPGSAARQLSTTIGPFSIINMIYAALCAQLLFGDLFNSRLCNALHAMPLRREAWFVTHVISGLLFSLVPHLAAVLLMMPMLGQTGFVGLIWLLGMSLEFLFFFGLAVFSVFCTGNRIAMAAVYSILNFASIITYWFVITIYEPMLYGLKIEETPFVRFSPVVQMTGSNQLIRFERIQKDVYYYEDPVWEYKGLGDGWDYLAICAVLGVVLLVLALLLYRKRKLESAGDFMAVKAMEPIFAAVFTLCAGCVFACVGELFIDDYLLFLVVGLILGWFVGQMLLQRTVKVFKGKVFLKLGILLVVLGATLLLTWLDPIGITRWVPDVNKVTCVEADIGSDIYPGTNYYLELTEHAQVQKIIDAHEELVSDRSTPVSARSRRITIRYHMTDGRKVTRTYNIFSGTKAWNTFEALYNTPEQILGYEDWDSFLEETLIYLEVGGLEDICTIYGENNGYTKEDIKKLYQTMKLSLLEALKRDCEEGLLSQTLSGDRYEYKFWLQLETYNGKYYNNRSITVYSISKNTLAWIEEYSEIIKTVSPVELK